MASTWIIERPTRTGAPRYYVRFRVGGRESTQLHRGVFPTLKAAKVRRDYIARELAARRVPDLEIASPEGPITLADAAERWQASRIDVSAGTQLT
jgi:hypothetical protein